MWRERLEQTPPYIEAWLSHQRRDAFWRHGSVCEDYAAITCPVYAVGGWADGYRSAVLRLLAGLPGPRKGLIGPWAHGYPDEGVPGPAIGFLQECLRWWDYWLKGRRDGDHGGADAAGLDAGIWSAPPRVCRATRAAGWLSRCGPRRTRRRRPRRSRAAGWRRRRRRRGAWSAVARRRQGATPGVGAPTGTRGLSARPAHGRRPGPHLYGGARWTQPWRSWASRRSR